MADDDPMILEAYGEILRSAGHEVHTALSGDEVLSKVRDVPYDLLLTDLIFPASDVIPVLKEVKQTRPSMLVVIFSGSANVENVLRAFRGGAYDFFEKPVPAEKLCELADRALEVRRKGEKRRRLAEELQNERVKAMQLRQQLGVDDPFRKIAGSSAAMMGFVDTLREIARTDSTVLITGESGTGKGLVAKTLHEASSRAEAAFVEANCVVYSEGVLQSELFGHERGAFTGAARTKKGRFELARGGTLFLDEIGEIPQSTQLMLLRVLQDRTFERVGGEETLEADVRLIAATNRDLQEAIAQGTFRSDLYYRLNVIPLHMPALRDHAEDIPVLAQHFMEGCASRLERPVERFTDDAIDALASYAWPGNVRELENMIERVVVLNRTGVIGIEDLPHALRGNVDALSIHRIPGTLQDMERIRIQDALEEAGGNKKLAAKRLGIHRSTLYAKLRKYGLMDDVDATSGRDAEHGVSEVATVGSSSS
ncbi:MAG: sigma-54-dependent Fis family transcriptional regulator [bacterium]|nr:sigma-54-dependent Fis family transcriptional regulator [bacterium]